MTICLFTCAFCRKENKKLYFLFDCPSYKALTTLLLQVRGLMFVLWSYLGSDSSVQKSNPLLLPKLSLWNLENARPQPQFRVYVAYVPQVWSLTILASAVLMFVNIFSGNHLQVDVHF
jgi:hypothetical protein